MKPGADRARITWTNTRLIRILQMTYDLLPDQISGPDWLGSESYDILATMPENTTAADFKLMVQNLLADRFRLVVHREIRQVAGYSLEVATMGIRIKESARGAPPQPAGASASRRDSPIRTPPGTFVDQTGFPAPLPDNPMFPPESGFGATIRVNGMYRATVLNQPMSEIARFLEPSTGMPVADHTGLTGRYDFHLEYKPDLPPAPLNEGGPSLPGDAIDTSAPGLDLFDAVQSQLGLKLVRKKVPREILVIDRAEKVPAEN